MSQDSSSLHTAELKVLEHLSEEPQQISQREIARSTGFSVGLINAVIQKLIRTGYVKTSRLNRRSIGYLLTPRGLGEKIHKSYHYVLKAIQSYQGIRDTVFQLIEKLSAEGVEVFYLYGESELADLLERFIKETNRGRVKRGLPLPKDQKQQKVVVLNATPTNINNGPDLRVIDLIRSIADASRNGGTIGRL